MTIRIRTPWAWPGRLGLLLVIGLLLQGCNKNKDGTDPAPGSQRGPQMGPPPGPPAPEMSVEEVLAKLPGDDEFAGGKKVYANNKCVNCHKLGDTGMGGMMGGPPEGKGGGMKGGPPEGKGGGMKGGRGGPGGPNLSNVGANPEHTAQWLADHIRDPRTHREQSRMPAYGADKISDADLILLAQYLASRK